MVSHLKVLKPALIATAFTEGLLCAGTVLIAFCMNYVLWLWSYECPILHMTKPGYGEVNNCHSPDRIQGRARPGPTF